MNKLRTLVVFGLCLLFSQFIYAQNANSITLKLSNSTIERVFDKLRSRYGYSFVYKISELDTQKKVSIDVTDSPIEPVLDVVLEGQDVLYTVNQHTITITKKAPISSTPQKAPSLRRISGTVLDSGDSPVAGATVVVKGTKESTSTNNDGSFTLLVPEGNVTLTCYFLGYSDQDISVPATQSVVSVNLFESASNLDELVVVGYGVQKKVNLTGAISVVEGADLSQRPVANVTQSLQGMAPGLLVTNGDSGRPGASATLQLRGRGNLSNNATPYVLIDGVEQSLSLVNPNDIESISVLKDAAACAIYGARAAYGVILVTTKKGEDGKMKVSYSGTAGWSAPTVLPDMANSYDFATYFNQACANAGMPLQYSDEKLALLQQYIADPSSVDPWYELPANSSMNPAFENTGKGVGNLDVFDLHYKDFAFKQNHNLSFRGGNKATQYFISGGFYDEDGILRFADMRYSRLNFNSNITSKLTKWMSLNVKTTYTYSNNKTPFGDGALSGEFYNSMARYRPTICEIDPNGHYTELSLVPYLTSGTYTNNQTNQFMLSPSLVITPVRDWNITIDYALRANNSAYEALGVAPLIYAADGITTSQGVRAGFGLTKDGKYTRSLSKDNYQKFSAYTDYAFSLGNHNIKLLGGFQEEKYNYSFMKTQVTGLYSTTNPGLNLADGETTIWDTRNGWATRGFFGRINYDYDGRYLVEINGRYDGSSRFAAENRWGVFPSASIGWNVANEKFMDSASDVVSTLKLRASYGLLGNQSGAALYTFAQTMAITSALGNYYFADGRHTHTNAPGVVDPNVTWEKVESFNAGIDFGFFDNALTGSFDIFQRDTKDMLGPIADYADLFGATSPQTNNASMRNRGWEFAINYKGNIGRDVQFSVGGSLSDATSIVTSYENPSFVNPQDNWYTGKTVGELWMYKSSGIIQTQEEADAFNALNHSYLSNQKWTPGDVGFVDVNNDGAISMGKNTLEDMGDQVICGNNTPRYQFTFNGNISWKGLSLSVMFQGVGKRDWMPWKNSVYFYGSGAYAQVTVFKQHLDYWTPENTDAYYPKPYTAPAGQIDRFLNKTQVKSDLYLQNAAYCRLKNITLSYQLPKQMLRKMGLDMVQVYFSGENLLTFTKLAEMFDPEQLFTYNGAAGGADTYSGRNYPMNKIYSIGLIINL